MGSEGSLSMNNMQLTQTSSPYQNMHSLSDRSDSKINLKLDTLSKLIKNISECKGLASELENVQKHLKNNELSTENTRDFERHIDLLIQYCHEELIPNVENKMDRSKHQMTYSHVYASPDPQLIDPCLITKNHSEIKIDRLNFTPSGLLISEDRATSSKKSLNRTISRISFPNQVCYNEDAADGRNKRNIQAMPVKLMYSDYMTKRSLQKSQPWLNKDCKSRIITKDASVKQLYQNTDHSENLENIDEEFFQNKSK
jgi:hypothetical protein